MPATKRQNWIDVLKGIGIILVVFGHVYSKNPVSIWIYSFHMPLFFALSGFIFAAYSYNKKVSFKDYFIKKLKSLIVPFILFRMILVLYWLAVERHFRELDLGPIWFLPVLFAAEIITYFINLKRNPAFNGIFAVICLAALYALKRLSFDNTAVGDWVMITLNGMCWYNFGILIGYAAAKKPLALSKWAVLPAVIVLFCASIFLSQYNGMVSMYSSVFGNYFIYIAESIIGILFILLLCKFFFTKNKAIEFLGKNTIIILATHEPIKRVILKLIEILSGKIGMPVTTDYLQGNIFAGLLVVLIIMAIEPVLIQVLRLLKSKSKGIVKECLSFVSD